MNKTPKRTGCADGPVADSHPMRAVMKQVDAAAPTDVPVLISGESGTGKEVVAQAIHSLGNRSASTMVVVNCAAIPADLFESEFFGHHRGAFTGAVADRSGYFEAADGGTLFLDEVGEIPVPLQGKLLRALQEGTFTRVGESRLRRVDVRVVAATNRNLQQAIVRGEFREDLYYRLNVFPLHLPPLRDRRDDIAPLAARFLENAAREHGKRVGPFSAEQLRLLEAYSWPGNVRELRNVVERAVILSQHVLRLDVALPPGALDEIAADPGAVDKLDSGLPLLTEAQLLEFERRNLIRALELADWRVSGPRGAAALLEMNASTLYSKMKAAGIVRPARDSLYSRIGGERTVTRFVNLFIPKLRLDPEVGRFWRSRGADSIRREKQMLGDFICGALGGPQTYRGRSMAEAHIGMVIDDRDWRRMLDILAATLGEVGVADAERDALLAIVARLEPEVRFSAPTAASRS